MKRFIFFVCLIVGINAIAIAQENEAVPRFSLGGELFVKSEDGWNGGSIFQIGWKGWF
jgi:hypothetical protein